MAWQPQNYSNALPFAPIRPFFALIRALELFQASNPAMDTLPFLLVFYVLSQFSRRSIAEVKKIIEKKRAMNMLVRTGYHTTKPNRWARNPPKPGKDHKPDREKNKAGASPLCLPPHSARPHTTHRPPRPPPPAPPGPLRDTNTLDASQPRTQPKTEEPAPGPRPGEPRPRPWAPSPRPRPGEPRTHADTL